jgi:2-alkyl-3-oxoalkanoate reductase
MERAIGTALITGATGFLGGHLAACLRRKGVAVVATGRDERKGQIMEDRLGVRFVRADLGTAGGGQELAKACCGVDTVFHVGALSSPWGKRADFVRSNVEGTRQVVAAAGAAGVGRLVHVSTPSLCFRFGSAEQVTEDAPLPEPVNDYVRTKREAERLVLEAAQSGMEVVVLRPRALIGAGDPSILPRLVQALAKGRLPVIGDGQNWTDLTSVENAAEALRLAAIAPTAVVQGKIYHLSNGTPVQLWPLLAEVARKLNLPEPRRRISRATAMALATVLEPLGRLTGREPALTKYGVSVLSDTQTLNIAAAQKDLAYAPAVSVPEGVERFLVWWKNGADYPFWKE